MGNKIQFVFKTKIGALWRILTSKSFVLMTDNKERLSFDVRNNPFLKVKDDQTIEFTKMKGTQNWIVNNCDFYGEGE